MRPLAVAVALSTVLAGCSVPRERDASIAASSAAVSAAVSRTPSATGAGAEPVAVPSAAAAVPSASPSVSRSVSPSVSPSPSPAPVRAPVPHQVAGYALTAAPRSLGNPLDVVRGARDLFCAGTARSVGKGGTPLGVLLLLALRPEYVGDHDIEAMLVPKVVAGITSGGVTPAFQTWSGLRVAVGVVGEGRHDRGLVLPRSPGGRGRRGRSGGRHRLREGLRREPLTHTLG